MLNPVHLRTLAEVVRLGSFARAANRLGYTASAVSQQMSALEQTVGVPLFERTARSAHPTEAARSMVRAAAGIFTELDAIVDAARGAYGHASNAVSVSLYASLARAALGRVLRDPELTASGIDLRFSVRDPSDAVRAIASGDPADISFVYRYAGSGLTWPSTAQQVPFGEDVYRVIAPTAWNVSGGAASVEELSGREWALHHPGSSDANVIDSVLRQAGLRPHVLAHCDSFDVVLELVKSGAAAAFVPDVVACIAPESVAVVDVPGMRLSRDVHALVSPSAPKDAADIVLRAFRRAMGEAGAGV